MGWLMGNSLLQGRNRERFAAVLEEMPVRQKLVVVQLRPCLDESSLALRQFPGDQTDGRDANDCNRALIVGVKMGAMVLPARLREHPHDNAVKTREFWHAESTRRSRVI